MKYWGLLFPILCGIILVANATENSSEEKVQNSVSSYSTTTVVKSTNEESLQQSKSTKVLATQTADDTFTDGNVGLQAQTLGAATSVGSNIQTQFQDNFGKSTNEESLQQSKSTKILATQTADDTFTDGSAYSPAAVALQGQTSGVATSVGSNIQKQFEDNDNPKAHIGGSPASNVGTVYPYQPSVSDVQPLYNPIANAHYGPVNTYPATAIGNRDASYGGGSLGYAPIGYAPANAHYPSQIPQTQPPLQGIHSPPYGHVAPNFNYPYPPPNVGLLHVPPVQPYVVPGNPYPPQQNFIPQNHHHQPQSVYPGYGHHHAEYHGQPHQPQHGYHNLEHNEEGHHFPTPNNVYHGYGHHHAEYHGQPHHGYPSLDHIEEGPQTGSYQRPTIGYAGILNGHNGY